MIHRLPALQRQLLFAVVAALGLHGLFLWLLAGPARGVESVTPGHRLIVRVLKPAAIQLLSSPAGDPAVASRLPPRRFFPAAQQSAPVRSSSPSTEAAVPAPSKSASEQAATETAAQAAPLRLDSSVLRAAVAQSKGTVRLMAEVSGSELPSSQVAVVAQLEAGVALSGKPSCLAANPTGSLLSLPLIALAAMTSQCN